MLLASASLGLGETSTGTGMVIGNVTNAPVRLLSTTHTIKDALQSAKFENKSAKPISAYRVGWASVVNGKPKFRNPQWMNVPANIEGGTIQTVPAQAIKPDLQARQMIFFIAEVHFADGSHWKAKRNEIAEGK